MPIDPVPRSHAYSFLVGQGAPIYRQPNDWFTQPFITIRYDWFASFIDLTTEPPNSPTSPRRGFLLSDCPVCMTGVMSNAAYVTSCG